MGNKRPKARKIEVESEILNVEPISTENVGILEEVPTFGNSESLFEDSPVPEVALVPQMPVSVADYSDDERKEFVRLIRERQSAEERAERLIELTGYTDERRAGVALRAIQEINALMGISVDKPTETAPLFVLPENTSVSVTVETPKK